MGWNDSRILLLAPGWRMVSEDEISGAGNASGMPSILHPERVSESGSTGICPLAIQGWLEKYGFEVRQRWESGIQLQWEDIEALLGIREGTLAEVNLTFTLTRNSPLRLDVWKTLVQHLSEAWGLVIYATELGFMVETDQFVHVLAGTPAWSDFATNFKWLPI